MKHESGDGRSMKDLPRKTRSQALESHRNDLYCDLQLRMTNDLGANDQQELVQLLQFQRNFDSKCNQKITSKGLLCEN